MKKTASMNKIVNDYLENKNNLGKSVYLSDLKSIFINTENIENDILLYEVEMIKVPTENTGRLNLGITRIKPVKINGEYAMTKGHIHTDQSQDEIYVCSSGKGILYLSRNGEEIFEEMSEGSVHYIDGSYAHRTINVGYEDLIFYASWSPNAGYDYTISLEETFPTKFLDNK